MDLNLLEGLSGSGTGWLTTKSHIVVKGKKEE